MSNNAESGAIPEITESFESVERLVMETPRGRWFLNEYAKRQKSHELATILSAIERLERAMNWKDAAAATGQLAGQVAKPAAPSAPDRPLEARHLRYFKKDEEIFNPAPAPKPVAMPSPESTPERKGARLIIRRKDPVDGAAVAGEPLPVAPVAEAISVQQPTDIPASAAAEEAPKRRIVIIRHKAGEEIDVPLQNELASAS